MKKIVSFLLITAFIVFSGCSSRKYFEPEDVVAKVKFDKNLPAKIIDIRRDGATLKNGQVITKDGLLNIYLPKGYVYIGGKDYIVGADDCGDVIIKDGKTTIFRKHFDSKKAVSANISNNILALLFDNNEIMVYDIKQNKKLYQYSENRISAVDAKIASPLFLDSLILFPTLDGKIDIYDKTQNKIIRTIIVGTKNEFNNIIFLKVIGNILIAATPNKIISVNPQNINSLNENIRDVIFLKDRVYILTNDGEVLLTDENLNILKSRKYPFAHFVGAIYRKYLYIIEKEGYIIAVDKDLRVSNIFKLEDSIDDFIFTSNDKIFYKDRFFQLAK